MTEISFNNFKEVLCKSLSDTYSVNEFAETTLFFDLKVDSLDMMQIIFDMESNFNIKINDCIYNNINKDTTLKDLYDYILKFQMI